MAAEAAVTYAAFVSYSHALDGRLAPALQGALQRFAKPWYRLRALRVFRDEASLAANPGLWASIQAALAASEFFVLLASPKAAASEWVQDEIAYWVGRKPLGNFLIALTDGDLSWDAASGDFDWTTTTALPPTLRGVFAEEPRYVDLRWARREEHLSLSDPRFRSCVADLAAPLHHRPKDDLLGEEVHQHRRTVRITRAAIAILTALVLVASAAAVIAVQQTRTAVAQRQLAVLQRNLATSRLLAAQADLKATTDLQAAMLLSAAAFKTSDTAEARSSLAQQLQRSQRIERFLGGAGKPTNGLAFSPDGRTLAATSGHDKEVVLWNVAHGDRRATLPAKDLVGAPVFSPDGRTLAVGEGDPLNGGRVVLWDVARRKRLAALTDGKGIAGPAFSPDGRILATAGIDETVRSYPSGKVVLWDVATRKQSGVLIGDAGAATGAFSPDGSILAMGQDADILLWDVARRTQLGVLTGGHTRGVFDFAFSPDGRTLASGGHDAKLILWDLPTRTQLASWKGSGDVNGVAFSPDGRVLAAGDNSATIALWDVAKRARLDRLTGGHISAILDLAFSPDGQTLASGGNDGRIILWTMASRSPLALATLPRAVSDLHAGVPAFSRDGRVLATVDGDDVVLWDVPRRARLARLAGASSVEPDTPGPLFSPDGRILAAGVRSTITLWDVAGHRRLATLNPGGDGIRGLAFSPDGRTLAAGGSGFQDITLWDVTRRKRVGSLSSQSGAPVFYLSYSPDGSVLAWTALESANTAIGGDFSVILWDIANNTRRATFTVHTSLGRQVVFSPDGRMLAWDGDNVTLWSVAQGARMATLTDPSRGRDAVVLASPVFSPDGRMLATTSSDKRVILWDVYPRSWVQRACSIAGRDLTRAEWAASLPDQPYRSVCG